MFYELFRNRKKSIITIFSVSFLLRLIAILLLGEIHKPQMWEFGILARNLYNGIGYSFNILDFNETIYTPVVSAHMPPGLVYIFLFFYELFGINSVSYFSILLFNSILGSLSCVIIYLIAERIYDNRTAVLSGLFVAISPIFIFSTINYNSIIIYHLALGLIFLYFLKTYNEKSNLKNVILLSLSISLILYFRSEMQLLMILVAGAFLLKKKFVYCLLILIIPGILFLPWTYRNYIVFGTYIPTTTSFGVNFHIGHNDITNGSQWLNGTNNLPIYWTDKLGEKLKKLPIDDRLEINAGNLAIEEALSFIKASPGKDMINSVRKLFYLWIIDPNNSKSMNPLYILSWFVTLMLFIIGYIFSKKDKEISSKLKFINIYLLMMMAVVVVFFTISRYQIQMSYLMIPTAMYGLNKLFEKINKHKKNQKTADTKMLNKEKYYEKVS